MYRGKGSQAKPSAKQRNGRLVRASKKLSRKKGLPPGTLLHVGKESTEKVRVCVLEYSENQYTERLDSTPQELRSLDSDQTCVWIHVEGLHDLEVVQALGDRYHLHPLVLEDIVNTSQRPKAEDLGDYLFLVMRILHMDDDADEMTSEQMTLILGANYLVTFREGPGVEFDEVRERIRAGKGRIRKAGPDYLAYALMDTVVDNHFVVLEKLAERIEYLEEELVTNPTRETLQAIHTLKTDMIFLRKSVWPLREMINRLLVGGDTLVHDSTLPYLRDLYDHTIHAIDTMETYRDIVSGMLDIYLSGMSNKLNEIMKVLTVIATIFIPLTFMTGWYGMNFKNMPELQWEWGYQAFMVLAGSVAATMLVFFWRKKWI